MIQYSIEDGHLSYDAGFYNKKEADVIYELLMSELKLRQNDIVIFGKEYKTPRLEGFYAKMVNDMVIQAKEWNQYHFRQF